MSNANESVEVKLGQWLRKQGYPMEMQVAQALRAAGAQVIQSDYYIDPVTSLAREVDVVASWDLHIEQLIVRITLTVECKSSQDKPWVLFVSRHMRLADPARVAQRATSEMGRLALWKLAGERSIQVIPLFAVPEAPGYSLTQAFTTGNDVCYTAISGVAAAVAAQAALIDHGPSAVGRIDVLEVIFPVVVTDAKLYTAELKEAPEPHVEEAESGLLLWRNLVVGKPHTIIDVVTLPSLTEFARKAATSVEQFFSVCGGVSRGDLLNIQRQRIRLQSLQAQRGE